MRPRRSLSLCHRPACLRPKAQVPLPLSAKPAVPLPAQARGCFGMYRISFTLYTVIKAAGSSLVIYCISF